MKSKCIITGAGLVGSLWAILLAKRGYEVEVYERRGDMRKADFVGGRSINLAMSNRGWRAIEKAGILEQIKAVALPMKGRMMHSTSGDLTFQAYGKEDEAIYSVSRGGLNITLMEIADEFDNVKFFFHKRCMGVNLKSNSLNFEDGSTASADYIFGTDGAFSAVRGTLQKTPMFNYSQSYLEHGYKELRIPPGENGTYLIDKTALHIWPRGQFMLIALPNLDGSFTCTLFLPFEGKESFAQLNTDAEIMNFFEKYFSDTLPLIPNLLENFRENPTSSLVTIKCNPWNYKDKVLLMGDASHAIVPFYGQGMNSGFEDCSIMDDLMKEYKGKLSEVIPAFNANRVEDADAISELALRNFVEMRDLVGDPKFLLRKKIGAYFAKKYPGKFLPLYSMVTFSHIPYSEALKQGKAQDALFEKILKVDNIDSNWQTEEVEQIFKNWLEED